MAFVGEQHYDQSHTNDGILNIKGQHFTKLIVTKHLKHNIIVNLCGKNTLEVEKKCNGDDDDDTNINDDCEKAPNDSNYHQP
jgi:hypothetical protein